MHDLLIVGDDGLQERVAFYGEAKWWFDLTLNRRSQKEQSRIYWLSLISLFPPVQYLQQKKNPLADAHRNLQVDRSSILQRGQCRRQRVAMIQIRFNNRSREMLRQLCNF